MPSPATSHGASRSCIELRQVWRLFGKVITLRDVDLCLYRGETLALVGESGCGKSVTMKLMMSLLSPSSGDVFWDGVDVEKLSARELNERRLRFGYLFQGAALFDSLTVFENVAFGLRQNTRMSEREIEAVVQARVSDVGLPLTACEKKPAELSGGMKKRVGLARALAMEPEVMFYDEPTTGLDPVMSDVINELILQTAERQGVTGVVVTHDMNTVRRVADRVVMLYPNARLEPDQPQVIFEGTPPEAFDSDDPRVRQFVRGEARERLREMAGPADEGDSGRHQSRRNRESLREGAGRSLTTDGPTGGRSTAGGVRPRSAVARPRTLDRPEADSQQGGAG